MKRTRGHVVQVDSLESLDRRVAAGAQSLSGWRLHGLDLRERADQLADLRVSGATFLGCTFAPGQAARLEAAGALVLPVIDDVPVDPYRSTLYSSAELYDAPHYDQTLDARAYAWSQTTGTAEDRLARALHDHAIDAALSRFTARRQFVGVMGGHAAQRGDPAYTEAARLGHGLGQTQVVATGGGPGAMEAANLGCFLAREPLDAVEDAIIRLAPVPAFRPVDAWLQPAIAVRDGVRRPANSLGVPTWFYGHEPSNVFATVIAKYFRNALREAILLQLCDAGIVFLPGVGGTVQEIFQDGCENYYADESSVASMVLVGRTYWTETLPAWPLLRALAKGRPMEPRVHLVDSVGEAVAVIAQATKRR